MSPRAGRFASFRIATVYLSEELSRDRFAELSFREEERGANVWLVTPNDEGVFHGSTAPEGIRCVHPVQVYLDLQAHPERAHEAAEKIRADRLNWKADG